jgi:proteasome accessory factor A
LAQRMFGMETEYALSAIGLAGNRHNQLEVVLRFMELIRKSLPHLQDKNSGGIFLQNGSRLYVDSGGHPELATCEVVNPWDACRYVMAGDKILGDLADQFPSQYNAVERLFLTRCNVCYSPGSPTTWGCHENYAHRADPDELRRELIPHLVGRLIYTGAGGFNNRSPGLEFMLSPRVAHLESVYSDSSTHNRGIFHSKDESLSRNGYHRLHLLCGESVCSTTALFLKVAVTALVVTLIEAGLSPCREILLRDPLGAMRRFAVDTRCTAAIPAVDGRTWTAVQIQRHILHQLISHADHPLMPSWTPSVCIILGEILIVWSMERAA